MISRRELLKGLGNATAAIALCNLLPALDGLSVQASPVGIASVENLMIAHEIEFGGDSFEWAGETQLSSPVAALRELHLLHGLDWQFSNQVNYRDASQCREHFRYCEANFRRMSSDIFTDVQRSQQDRDVAYMTGGNFNQRVGRWNQIFGSTQFQGNPAVQILNDDPGIILAASQTFGESYAPQPKEIAQSATLTAAPQSSIIRVGDEQLVSNRYLTPKTEVIHYPRPVRRGRYTYNKGLLAVRRKNVQADKWKFKGLYV